ncbi:MAG: glutamyl-tRNA reductase [Opitutales bacterium]|nr:glutamyl-tRNA reductase [Opitutales bacterium]
MEENRKNLYLAGISHQCADSQMLGQCGVSKDFTQISEDAILKIPEVSETLVLSTCNRVEIYLVATSQDAISKAIDVFCKSPPRDCNAQEFEKIAYKKTGKDVIEHIFEVASGLQSQMTGETEILGQVKSAYANASSAGHCSAILNTVFQKANQCAKWVRTNTDIGHGKISLGSVASELADRIFNDITKAKILLLGSGEAGKLVAEALFVRGANNITVASRRFENAQKLASEIGVLADEMKNAIGNLFQFDIVITASFSPTPLIDVQSAKNALKKRNDKPIFLIDLAVPNNIVAECENLDDIYLYNLDDLSKIANENISMRKSEIEIARRTILEKSAYTANKLGII